VVSDLYSPKQCRDQGDVETNDEYGGAETNDDDGGAEPNDDHGGAETNDDDGGAETNDDDGGAETNHDDGGTEANDKAGAGDGTEADDDARTFALWPTVAIAPGGVEDAPSGVAVVLTCVAVSLSEKKAMRDCDTVPPADKTLAIAMAFSTASLMISCCHLVIA
jgi:hypothetical protein